MAKPLYGYTAYGYTGDGYATTGTAYITDDYRYTPRTVTLANGYPVTVTLLTVTVTALRTIPTADDCTQNRVRRLSSQFESQNAPSRFQRNHAIRPHTVSPFPCTIRRKTFGTRPGLSLIHI